MAIDHVAGSRHRTTRRSVPGAAAPGPAATRTPGRSRVDRFHWGIRLWRHPQGQASGPPRCSNLRGRGATLRRTAPPQRRGRRERQSARSPRPERGADWTLARSWHVPATLPHGPTEPGRAGNGSCRQASRSSSPCNDSRDNRSVQIDVASQDPQRRTNEELEAHDR